MLGAIGKSLYYNQPYLNGTDCNSSTFLREISYKVNLTDLYKVVGTCFTNAQMNYCPMLVQINHSLLKKEYKCEYLLQVWNIEGRKVYERPLQNPIKIWAVSNDFLIYKPQIGDENFDCYHLVNLGNQNSTLLIKDCINDPTCNYIAYLGNVLYIANKSTIFLLDIKQELGPGEMQKVDLASSPDSVQRILPGLTIHGLFNHYIQRSKWFKSHQIIVVMETDDNQLDFSQIFVQHMGTKNFTYQLKQQREMVERKIEIDPIQKFQYIIDEKNIFYGIALRQSGHFDIYWNMTLIDSPQNVYAQDISLSFDEIYMQLVGNEIRGIDTISGSSLSYEQAHQKFDDFEFPIVFYQNIKNHVHLYNSFCLIRTTLYVVHGSYISLYNIQESQWLKHVYFTEGQICKLFKKLSKGVDNKGKEKHELCVILDNGSIYNDIQSFLFADEKNKKDEGQSLNIIQTIMIVNESRRNFKLDGEIVRAMQDQQKNEWIYIMTKEKMMTIGQEPSDLIRLFVVHYNKLFEIKEGLENPVDCNYLLQ